MRLFYGVVPSEREREDLHRVQRVLLSSLSSYRKTDKDNLHLTLHFLGEKEEEQLPGLRELLDRVSRGHTPFTLSFREVDFFQKKNRKILWLGPDRGKDALEEVWQQMGVALKASGHEVDDRPFRPHLTLARQVKGRVDRESIPPILLHVDALHLMESTRVEGRLVYRSIYRVPLG